jgi:hypothetical protein
VIDDDVRESIKELQQRIEGFDEVGDAVRTEGLDVVIRML